MEAQTPNINFEDTQEVTCQNCGGQTFRDAYVLRKVSHLLTGEAGDRLIPISVLQCTGCDLVLEDALPADIKDRIECTDRKQAGTGEDTE